MDDAFVNAVTSTGASALHLVASRGVPEVVKALLADGRCDVALKDFKGKTALDRSSRNHAGTSKMLEDVGAEFAGSAFPTAPDVSTVNIPHTMSVGQRSLTGGSYSSVWPPRADA